MHIMFHSVHLLFRRNELFCGLLNLILVPSKYRLEIRLCSVCAHGLGLHACIVCVCVCLRVCVCVCAREMERDERVAGETVWNLKCVRKSS